MSLFRNTLPILEYDDDSNAIIMPGHSTDFHFPERAIMLFMETEVENYALENDCEIIGQFITITKLFPVYKTVHNGVELAVCQAPLGGAAATQIMEQLIAGGVKKIIATGCCGALFTDNEGDFYIPVSALRQEGTSYHYLPPSREVSLNDNAINAIAKVLNDRGFSYKKCKTWTTDGFYRETKEMVEYRKAEGCSVVEMECASLAACAEFRNIIFGQLLFTADSLANIESHDTRNWGNRHFSLAMDLAMDAAVEVN
ncbi:nucleoside phosphorylase [Ruminococcus sp.]|uniref:nucleoside phosphorylase n=1 Tax=Ruminococcus sp. TaxID=41978 RepID=UPI0038909A6D